MKKAGTLIAAFAAMAMMAVTAGCSGGNTPTSSNTQSVQETTEKTTEKATEKPTEQAPAKKKEPAQQPTPITSQPESSKGEKINSQELDDLFHSAAQSIL